MPNKTNSKNSTIKILTATVGAIVATIAIEHITRPKKEDKIAELRQPEGWDIQTRQNNLN